MISFSIIRAITTGVYNMLQKGPRPLVLCGPSGSGKSTLIKQLFEEYPDRYGFSVSHTTRKPRPGEEHAKHYYFTTKEKMEKQIELGEFLETATFSGNLYGTSFKGREVQFLEMSYLLYSKYNLLGSYILPLHIKEICAAEGNGQHFRLIEVFELKSKKAVEDVQREGKICILDIEIQGVKQVKQSSLNPLYVFIKPPSMDELERRLRNRKTETEEALKNRLSIAGTEIEYGEKPGNFDLIIVNDDVSRAYENLKEFINENILQKFAAGTV